MSEEFKVNPFEILKHENYHTLLKLTQNKEYKGTYSEADDVPIGLPEVWAKGDVTEPHKFSTCCGGVHLVEMLEGLADKKAENCVEYGHIVFKLDGKMIVSIQNTNPAKTNKVLIVDAEDIYRKKRNQNYLISLGLTAVGVIGLVAFFK